MKKYLPKTLPALLLAVLLTGCASKAATPPVPAESASSAQSAPAESATSALEEAAPRPLDYCAEVAGAVLAEIVAPNMTPYEQVLAAYEHIISGTFFAEPVGLELWRVRGGKQPSYVENRALSPLLFGVGTCEDYAAALTLLLRGLGLEAEYLPGLTISVDGGFVDHAWVVAKLDGVWYHLDPQLEQNVMKNNTLTYRYFLKSDENMLADHRWGENMLRYGGLDEGQQKTVREQYLAHPCPRNYAVQPPAPKRLPPPTSPDRAALEGEANAEVRRYEELHGALPPLKLNIVPPVFGYEGYREAQKK